MSVKTSSRPQGHEPATAGPHFQVGVATEAGAATAQAAAIDTLRTKRSSTQISLVINPTSRSFINQAVHDLRTGLPLLGADVLGLVLSLGLAGSLVDSVLGGHLTLTGLDGHAAVSCAVYLLLYLLMGLYPGAGLNPIVELKQFTLGTLTATTILLVASGTLGGFVSGTALAIIVAGLFAACFVPVFRAVAREILGRCRWWGQPTLVIGTGRSGKALFDALQRKPGKGLRPVGIMGDPHLQFQDSDDHPAYLGPISEVDRIASQHKALWALVALQDRSRANTMQILERCTAVPHLILVPGFEELPSLWNQPQDVGGALGIYVRERLLCPSAQLTKRFIDVAAVLLGCLVLAPILVPLMTVMCVFMKVVSPGPIIYGSDRIGKNGRRFKMWKVRTMIVDADKSLEKCFQADPELRAEYERSHKLLYDPRIIPGIGNFMRKTSLDELPQLLLFDRE